MAKRKRRKKEENKREIKPGVYGILLIIIAILSYGPGKPLGWVGKMARCFAIFLFGSLDWLFILTILIIGISLLFRGKSLSFWSTKFIGLLLVAIGVLVFAHLNYIKEATEGVSGIFDATMSDLNETFELVKDGADFASPGGGIVGCSIAVGFNFLFATNGTKIVSVILMIAGTCLFTGFSIRDFFAKATEKGKSLISKNKDDEEEDDDSVVIINDNDESKEESDTEPKLVISSLDELKRMDKEAKEQTC